MSDLGFDFKDIVEFDVRTRNEWKLNNQVEFDRTALSVDFLMRRAANGPVLPLRLPPRVASYCCSSRAGISTLRGDVCGSPASLRTSVASVGPTTIMCLDVARSCRGAV